MKKTIPILLIGLIFVSANTIAFAQKSSAPADAHENQDYQFRLIKARIMPLGAGKKVLALTFDFQNQSLTRKIDLRHKFSLTLSDEFQNTYQLMDDTRDFPEPLTVPNPNYPSLYPAEIYQETALFEPPIHSCRRLFLEIDASAAGLSAKIILPISRTAIEDLTYIEEFPEPQMVDLRIVYPPEGRNYFPGDNIVFQAEMDERLPIPDVLYVISPNYLFEDPEKSFRYQIRVPENQKFGPFRIVIMALWQNTQKETFLSKSVTVNIADPYAECVENCSDRRMTAAKKH